MDQARGVEGELKGDGAAIGIADDVRPVHAEFPQERSTVPGLFGNADRTIRMSAGRKAATMVANQAVSLGQRRLGEQRSEDIGEDTAVNEDNRLTGAAVVILQPD